MVEYIFIWLFGYLVGGLALYIDYKELINRIIKLELETCETHKPKVCYIKFKDLPRKQFVEHSESRHDCVVDYDKNGKIVGIEFYDGLPLKVTKE